MTDPEVRIVRLEAMRVASVRAISESPEREAWDKMRAWAESSRYKHGRHQGLEKAHNPGASEEDLVLDLYCPVEE